MGKNMGFKLEKKQQRSRAEAEALYHELHRRMTKSMGQASQPAAEKQSTGAKTKPSYRTISGVNKPNTRGAHGGNQKFVSKGALAAVIVMIAFAGLKVTISAMEALDIGEAKVAHASIDSAQIRASYQNPFSPDEVKILTSLDQRRVELDSRIRDLANREADLNKRDREFAVKLTELRELSKSLKLQRDKNERKRVTQLEQLAHVYGSMNPTESAILIEQLDITIALELVSRMPEKRIGQILSLMSPDRALMITKMLSGQS